MMAMMMMMMMTIMMTSCVSGQRTYMRTCECEYVSDGKCAYTLLLPIGEASATCQPSSGSTPSGQQTTDLSRIEWQLADLQLNVTILKEWSNSQSRLLSQLQSVIISLQSEMSLSGPTTTKPERKESTTASAGVDLSQLKRLTDNLGNNIQALSDAQTATSKDISSLNVVLTDLVRRMTSVQQELAKLGTRVADQQNEIASLRAQINDVSRYSCRRRGLLVSGREATIPDSNISASSQFNELHGPARVRINNTDTPGAWCPKEPNANYEWIQFDLGHDRLLLGTVSKGRYDFAQWVTSYRVEYSSDEQPLLWKQVTDVTGNEEIFQGNHDRNTIQVNIFWTPIRARLVRIIPIDVVNNANKCMRADVIGCLDNEL